jgi:amidohydrolase
MTATASRAPAVPSIDALIQKHLPALRALRHDLHKHPELSFKEHRTSEVVQRELEGLGLRFKAGLAGAGGGGGGQPGTGVVAIMPASTPEGNTRPAVALRADMDALPITEATGKPYASCTPGVMHACGHDGHTTMLLGAARVLAEMHRPQPVTFIFQPAEEDGGGAEKLCEQGVLLGDAGKGGGGQAGIGNRIARIYGLHGWPSVPLGVIGTRAGPMLASTDEFDVTIRGVGGHAAYPHLCKDPIVAASACVLALQTVVSRAVSPLESAVVTVGLLHAGTANNIIPETAHFVGTFRALNDATRALGKARILETIARTAEAHGCTAESTWLPGYPVTHNHPDEAERVLAIARASFGPERAHRIEHPTMGGEDFAYYGRARDVAACFFFLGLRPPGAAKVPALHQPDFDFNDDAMPTGIEMLVRLAGS